MSDSTLLVFGCTVSFIVVAGAYVYLRERFTGEVRPAKSRTSPAKAARRGSRRAA